MPLEKVQEKELEATIWDTDRFQENMFLGVVKIPLKNIFLNYKLEKWHVLIENEHRKRK